MTTKTDVYNAATKLAERLCDESLLERTPDQLIDYAIYLIRVYGEWPTPTRVYRILDGAVNQHLLFLLVERDMKGLKCTVS